LLDEFEDDCPRGLARRFDNHQAVAIGRRVAQDIAEVPVSGDKCQSIGSGVRCNFVVGCRAKPNGAHVRRPMTVGLNQGSGGTGETSIDEEMKHELQTGSE